MAVKTISGGVVHKMPADLKKTLTGDDKVLKAWKDITPLARNEFVCWVEDAKKPETRARRIRRTAEELAEGQRRPCCWVGCVHRTDKPMSATQKWVVGKKSKKS
ncbi:MAG TPA: YdeI/OmpD-associated family protein [Candidatus Saccharimonadales bacterium]